MMDTNTINVESLTSTNHSEQLCKDVKERNVEKEIESTDKCIKSMVLSASADGCSKTDNCEGIFDQESTHISPNNDNIKETKKKNPEIEFQLQGLNEFSTSVHPDTQIIENENIDNDIQNSLKRADEFNETLLIESDEDITKKIDQIPNLKDKVGDITPNEGIKCLGDNGPNSPDLFASQIDDIKNEKLENNLMDSEDIIPSSLTLQSEGSENRKDTLSEVQSNLTTQKRKLREDIEHNDSKVLKLELPLKNPLLNKFEKKYEQEQQTIEITEICVDTKTGVLDDTSVPSKKSQFSDRGKEVENSAEIRNDTVDGELVNAKEKPIECSVKSLIGGSESLKDQRKSLEIIYSSFENLNSVGSVNTSTSNLLVIPEENGDESEEEIENDSFHLRISLSPSQITQSFSETDNSRCEETMDSNSDFSGKTGGPKNNQRKLSNTHDTETDTKKEVCIGKEVEENFPDTVTIDDNSDIHEQTPDSKISVCNDIEVLQTLENCSVVKHDSDSDVTVLLDKSYDSSKSCNSGSLKNMHVNETMLKRKCSEPYNVIGEHISHPGDQVDSVDASDQCKRSRRDNIHLESRSASDNSFVLQNKDSPLPLKVVKCTYAIQVQLHVHDQLRQVHSIEMVQCQSMEDFSNGGKVVNHVESSDGAAADESKNSSPSSVTSLGPFGLKSQLTRMSTSSSSTNSSGHSNIGCRSKSDDMLFTAPMKRAPCRNTKGRSLYYSPDFERELFELAEKTYFLDDMESKLPFSVSNITTSSTLTSIHSAPHALDEIKNLPQTNPDSQNHVETPKSTKRLARNRHARSNSRTFLSKLNEASEEPQSSPQIAEEQDASNIIEASGSQKKTRRAPTRSSKRSATNTPNTRVISEEAKISTSDVVSSGRSRRNRNEPNQSEKVDSSSQESSHVYDWDSDTCFTKLLAGAPVFARWVDKKYYPGIVKEKMKDGRWVIEFDDNTVRSMKEEFIIPINILPKGQIVFAYDGDEYEQGIIVEFKLKGGEVQHGIDLDSGRQVFLPRSRLFMSEDQARLLQDNTYLKIPTTSSPAITTVTCDNIVNHKRPRSTRVLFGSSSPSVSGIAKTAKRPSHDNSCSSSLSDCNDKGNALVLEEIVGVEPEVPSSFPELMHTPSGRGKGPGRIKSKSRTPRRNATANYNMAEDNRLQEILGPIPEKGSKMFSGKCFLLTYSGIKSNDYAASKENDVSSDENSIASTIPFVRDHLKCQLESGGGTVYENFEDVPKDQYQHCLLITDRPCLTAKYILCLANGIKIIKHLWVIAESKGENLPLGRGRLPNGWDIEGKCLVDSESGMRTRKQKPLNKKEVGIVYESQTFVKFWERILELLGANVRHISPGSPEQDRQFSGVNVILTDSTCPPEVQDRAREWIIPLVSTVWVTQTLIVGKIRSFTGHPHYRYDYCGSD